MIKLESVEKLRECASRFGGPDWDEIGLIATDIEEEVARRLVERPVDADGMPWHVMDEAEYPGGMHEVVWYISLAGGGWRINGTGPLAASCRHVRTASTVEGVLEEFWRESMDADRAPSFEKWADKLREAVMSE